MGGGVVNGRGLEAPEWSRFRIVRVSGSVLVLTVCTLDSRFPRSVFNYLPSLLRGLLYRSPVLTAEHKATEQPQTKYNERRCPAAARVELKVFASHRITLRPLAASCVYEHVHELAIDQHHIT